MSEPAPATGALASGRRWFGLDALRGLTIAAMILLNNPGSWAAGHQYAPLTHAPWHGCTFTDLVFPTFLFCAGVAIVPAFTKKLAAGLPRGPLALGVGKRVLWLLLLGLFLSAFPLVTFAANSHWYDRLLGVRFPGVLQRIGVCYGLAALLFLFTKVTTQRLVLAACLLGYWALITWVPVPGVGAPNLDEPMGTLQGYVDRLVFGDHIYKKGKYDPEGLLSTIPALASCLWGVEAGRLLVSNHSPLAKVHRLLAGGALLMALGWAWSWALPLNKELWTSSYVLWSAGIATVALAVSQWAFDVHGWRRLGHPLQVYGVNALLVFVGSGVLGRLTGSLITTTIEVGGKPKVVGLRDAFYQTILLPCFGDAKLASLAFALLWIAGWYAVLAWLFRRGLVWKV